MRFGIFYIAQWHESKTQEQTLREAIEEIQLADRLGIDEVWLGEHHFSRLGLLSGIFSFAGYVAARTERIRVGTAIIVLPFRNPIVVAEEAATIDVLSGGRFDLGVGAGYQRQEFDGMGARLEEARERFQESLDVITRAWTEDTLTFHGKFTNVEDLQVIPKPLQVPHPPLFIAASTSPSSVEYAAGLGIPIMLRGPTSTMGQVPQAIRLWCYTMEKSGYEHAHIDPPVSIDIYVAPTMEEVEQDPVGRDDFMLKIVDKIGSPVGKDGTIPGGYEAWTNRQRDRELAGQPGYDVLPTLRGTPEVVAERIEEVRGLGINHIFGYFGFPGLPHEKVMRSIEMFATEVMPRFRDAPAEASTAGSG